MGSPSKSVAFILGDDKAGVADISPTEWCAIIERALSYLATTLREVSINCFKPLREQIDIGWLSSDGNKTDPEKIHCRDQLGLGTRCARFIDSFWNKKRKVDYRQKDLMVSSKGELVLRVLVYRMDEAAVRYVQNGSFRVLSARELSRLISRCRKSGFRDNFGFPLEIGILEGILRILECGAIDRRQSLEKIADAKTKVGLIRKAIA